jgi:hypothetical protein
MAQELSAQQQQPVTMTPLPRAEDLRVVEVVEMLMSDAERQAEPMRPPAMTRPRPESTAAPGPPPDESPRAH